MEKNLSKLRVVLDTNVIIYAIISKGKPREIFELVLNRTIEGITSKVLLTELGEVLSKKFHMRDINISFIESELKEALEVVQPKEFINVAADEADNRVLEAAVEGKCVYIITGDEALLELKKYKRIQIVSPANFVKQHDIFRT